MTTGARWWIVAAVAAAAYGNTLRNGFVWDDHDAIVENYFITQWSNAPQLLTRAYFLRAYELSYRPLVTLTYFVDYSLWKLRPFGYHLTNAVLHALTAVALLSLLRRLTRNEPISLAASALFACHPAASEAVNVVAFREDLMAALFVFAGFLGYLRFREAAGWRRPLWLGGALLSYFLGMLSKEVAAALPGLLALSDGLGLTARRPAAADPSASSATAAVPADRGSQGRRRGSRLVPAAAGAADGPAAAASAAGPSPEGWRAVFRAVPAYAAFAAVLLAYLSIRFYFMRNPKEAATGYLGGSLGVALLTTSRILATYIRLMVLPFGLCAQYEWTPSRFLLDTDVVLSLALLLLTLGYAWRRRRADPAFAFGVFGFFVLLLPVCNVIPIVNAAAERYLYAPCAAFSLAAASELARRRVRGWVTVVLVAAGVGLTAWRNTDWKDNATIWSRTARRHPNSADIHHELGDIHHRERRLPEAIEEYRKALALNPRHLAVRVNLGVCYDELGDLDAALAQYRMAVEIDPSVSKVHNNIGNICFKQGRLEEAIAAYREAIRLHPHYPEPHHNLSIACARLGRMSEAVQAAEQEVALAPDRTEAWLGLARLQLARGDAPAARSILDRLAAGGAATASLEAFRRELDAGGAAAGTNGAGAVPPAPAPLASPGYSPPPAGR